MKTAQPVKVSECKYVCDNVKCYTGEISVIVDVKGNCTSRVFLGGTDVKPPKAFGGNIYHINYMSDANISVIEYRFEGAHCTNNSEKFRQKMLKKINKQKIKDYIAQLDGNTNWVLLSLGKQKVRQ